MERERLKSRIGFILLSAGCAIGIGNVWKFPYMAGQYGGGIFVLFYLFFMVILGIPVMTAEFAMGRASRKSPVLMYQALQPKGGRWHWHGLVAFAGNVLLMMFYTTVSGWMVRYFVDTAKGDFVGLEAQAIGEKFGEMLSQPLPMVGYMSLVVVAGFLICSIGLQKGLEATTKYMMGALIVLMFLLAVNSLLLPGAAQGLHFYLWPDVEQLAEVGWARMLVGAMNQSFFSLSLGIGAMAIFGSYIDNKKALVGESFHVAILDTLVALMSGLIIFPACFSYGVEVGAGPSLVFITLPNIFNNLPLGRLWGSFFFLFLTFAAFSTVLAVFENIMACLTDLFGWSRQKAAVIGCIGILLLSLPCALGFNLLSDFQPLGPGSGVLDLEDFLVSNILLPLGALIFVLFSVSRYGWGWKRFMEEANKGEGPKVAPWMRWHITYIIPALILALFGIGLWDFFNK